MSFSNRYQKSERESFIPQQCRIAVSEELSAYADGMLEGSALREISAHTSHCVECTEALRDLACLRTQLQSVRNSPVQADDDYWTQLYRAVRQEPRVFITSTTRPGILTKKACMALSAAAGIAFVGFFSIAPRSLQNGTAKAHVQLADGALQGSSAPGLHASRTAQPELSINALVESHARMVSDQSSEDHARAAFIVSDLSARASGEAAPPAVLQETSLQTTPGVSTRSVVSTN